MSRFDVYPNPSSRTSEVPYVLDVQSDLLADLDSRVVIPLRRLGVFAHVRLPQRMCPVLQVGDEHLLLETPKLAAIPRKLLKNPVQSLAAEQTLITAALDFVFQGY